MQIQLENQYFSFVGKSEIDIQVYIVRFFSESWGDFVRFRFYVMGFFSQRCQCLFCFCVVCKYAVVRCGAVGVVYNGVNIYIAVNWGFISIIFIYC